MRRALLLRRPHAAAAFVAAVAIAAATIPVTAALTDTTRSPATTVDAATVSHSPRPDAAAALIRAAAWLAERSATRITTPLDVRLATPPAWLPVLALLAALLLVWSRARTARDMPGRLPGRRAPPLASI